MNGMLCTVLMLPLAGGCFHRAPAYVPAGEAQMDIEGTYTAETSELSVSCQNWHPRVGPSDVEVYYTPKSTVFRVLVDDVAFDAAMKGGGKFDSKTVATGSNGRMERRTLSGQFKGEALSARMRVSRGESGRSCDYVLALSGRRR